MWQATQFRDTNAINDGVVVALNLTVRGYFRPDFYGLIRKKKLHSLLHDHIVSRCMFFNGGVNGGLKFGSRFFREESALLRTPWNYHHGGGIQIDNMIL